MIDFRLFRITKATWSRDDDGYWFVVVGLVSRTNDRIARTLASQPMAPDEALGMMACLLFAQQQKPEDNPGPLRWLQVVPEIAARALAETGRAG